MNLKEVSIADKNFIFPVVDGTGREITELLPNIEYRLIKRNGYYVILERNEIEIAKPIFSSYKINDLIEFI